MGLLKRVPVSYYISSFTVQSINYSKQQRELSVVTCYMRMLWWFCISGSQEDVDRLSEQLVEGAVQQRQCVAL